MTVCCVRVDIYLQSCVALETSTQCFTCVVLKTSTKKRYLKSSFQCSHTRDITWCCFSHCALQRGRDGQAGSPTQNHQTWEGNVWSKSLSLFSSVSWKEPTHKCKQYLVWSLSIFPIQSCELTASFPQWISLCSWLGPLHVPSVRILSVVSRQLMYKVYKLTLFLCLYVVCATCIYKAFWNAVFSHWLCSSVELKHKKIYTIKTKYRFRPQSHTHFSFFSV